MTHGSLFSGIGGFDLAASWLGWENTFFCELDPFCRIVLKKHWPYATIIEDIKKFPQATPFTIDVLSGGFPCQAFSVAGKRLGSSDPRYLWPAMFDTIKRLKPPFVVAENVMGIVSWNGGLVFEQVHADLESAGYQVWTFVLPACAVGAPHVRRRAWFLAFHPGYFRKREAQRQRGAVPFRVASSDAAHTHSQRLEGAAGSRKIRQAGRSGRRIEVPLWDGWPTQPAVCGGDDGLPGRLAGITIPAWRKHAIMALGNAIVPQVALEIFKVIELHYQNELARLQR